MNFSPEERLAWLDAAHYQQGLSVFVEEKEEAGAAKVFFDADIPLLSISLSQKNALNYLVKKKVADGVVCKIHESRIDLLMVECKKTITSSSWSKAKEQFGGAVINALAFCGVLGLEISSVRLATAYRTDRLTDSPDPVLFKTRLGSQNPVSAVDWHSAIVSILGQRLQHVKIQLDEQGCGRYQL